MHETPRARLATYGLAVLATALTLLIRWALMPVLGERALYSTFLPAIAMCAYLGGVWPGLLATGLSALSVSLFIRPLHYSPQSDSASDAVAVILFVLVGTVISGLSESRLRAHRRIKASERRYAVTLASIGDAVIATDNQARVTFLNPVAESLTGWSSADAVGRPLAEVFRIVNEQTRQPVEDPAAKVLRLGTVVGLANRTALLARDGREVPIDDCGAPMLDDHGAAGVVLVFRDVTQRRQAEEGEAFRRANERMEQALRGSSVGMWEVEMPDGDFQNGRRYYLNLWEQLGYDPNPGDEVASPFKPKPAEPDQTPFTAVKTGRPAWEPVFRLQIHPDDLDRLQESARRYLTGETSGYETEIRLRHKDGSYRTMLSRGTAVRDASGKPIRFAGVTVDITQLRLAEEELRRTTVLLQAVADGTQDAVYLKDRQGRHLMFNAAASRMVGKPIEEVLGRDDSAIFDPDSARAAMAHDRRVMESGVPDTDEKDLTAGGVTRSYLASKAPYRDGHGNVIGIIGVCHDITERKRAEEARRQANERLELALRGSNIGFWDIDMPDGDLRNGRVHYVNVWEQLGYERPDSPKDQEAGMTLVHPDDRVAHAEAARRYLAGETSEFEVESRVCHKDGSYRWMISRGVAVRDAGGKPIRFLGTGIDITDLKRAEEALRRANDRVELAVRSSNISIWDQDMPDGCIENAHVNLFNVWESLGHDPHTMPTDYSSACAVFYHPDDLERVGREVQDLLASDGQEWKNEYRVRTKAGSTRWLLARGTVLRDPDGKPVRFIGTSTDITDRKQAEEALRESEGRFRGTFENAAVGIGHRHLDGRLLRVNQKMCNILGYSRDELLQLTGRGITHPDDLAADVDLAEALLRGESPGITLEKRYLRRDGSPVWVDFSVALQRDAAGNPDYFIGIIQDISERKRLDAELRQAKDLAEAANRAKDEFLANVSHEIRTPMNAILGMTELALDTPLTEDQRQYLKAVKSGAESLLGIINDLLDFSKIEAAKMELEPAPFSVRAAVGDTLRVLASRAHKKGLELASDVHPDVPDALVGDAGRLRQVLLNLVGNAIKFTDEGEVVVRVKATDAAPDGEAELHFEVRDTGIGIAPDKRETIFRAFEQEDTSTTRKYGGTGLGLTIASRLIALMGGTIGVESELGRGSAFTFSVRLGRPSDQPEPAAARPPVRLHDLRVLVVDDNATNRQILEGWLRDWQMEPHAVGDGLSALNALWHAAAAGRPYPLVLLDARMPDTDGLKLAAMIRERAELSATRLILLTSGDRPGDPARARELRIDAHLLKPVQPDELLETIARVMNDVKGDPPPTQPVSVAQPVPAPPTAALRILVAEDNELSASLLEQLLARRGHEVTLAGNGRDALALAVGGGFDLVLLDVHMPEMDGFQVVGAVRSREQTSGGHLPVIALTARSRKEDRERCLAAGADDFLSKPIRTDDLWAVIDRVVDTFPPAERPGRLVDPRVLLAACDGDPAILQKLCQTLHAHLPQHFDAVRHALRSGNPSRVRDAAHLLWGTVAAFSTATAAVASELEERAARGRADECGPLVERLEPMVAALLREVDGVSADGLRDQATK